MRFHLMCFLFAISICAISRFMKTYLVCVLAWMRVWHKANRGEDEEPECQIRQKPPSLQGLQKNEQHLS